MTKQEYQSKLLKILESMIGEEVIHDEFGLGTIIGFEENICIVKYERFDNVKMMSSERFFQYNEPVSQSTIDDINELKCEYELTNKKNKIQKDIINEQTIESEKDIIKSNNKITFDDVIGLDDVKELINRMVVYPFKYKEIYKAFNRDSGGGILLYGAPGTGKTMIAKAIANEIDAEFYSIKCSDIASKWYGESARNIKKLFDKARSHERSIIFFDEFDSLGSNRDHGNYNSVNMVVSELLSQIDGFESKKNTVLLIASTNKPWNIDSALLRSGRFNKKIYIGLPDKTSRINLLIHELKDSPLSKVDFESISEKTEGYSSADIVELCNETKDIAIKRSIQMNQISPINQKDLIKALSMVSSTIVKDELDRLANFAL